MYPVGRRVGMAPGVARPRNVGDECRGLGPQIAHVPLAGAFVEELRAAERQRAEVSNAVRDPRDDVGVSVPAPRVQGMPVRVGEHRDCRDDVRAVLP